MEDKLNVHGSIIKESLVVLRSRVPECQKEVIDKLQEKVTRILKFAPILDWQGVPANGVRSSVDIFSNWLEYASDLFRNNEDVEKFIPILYLMSRWCDFIEKGRQLYDDDGNFIRNDLNKKIARKLLGNGAQEFDEKGFAAVHGEGYFLRCFPVRIPAINQLYRFLLLATSYGPSEFIFNLLQFSTSNVVSQLSKQWHRINDIQHVVKLFRLSYIWPNKIFSTIYQSLLSIGKPRVKVNEYIVDFKRKYNICVDVEDIRLQVLPEQQNRKVTFSILKDNSSKEHHGKVLMFMHGGGFIGPHYKVMDNFVTKDLCNEIPGLTVMTVKYSFAPEKPFPHGLMDALDTYLWLTSSDPKVQDILGFKPQDIIVSGESSGGNFSLSLAVLINEIRLLDENFKPVFPSSLLLTFPNVSVEETLYMSQGLSCIDLMLGYFAINTIAQAYLPIRIRDKNGNYSIANYKDIPADWLTREEYEFIRSPFLSPVYYDKLQDLSHVRISVMAAEYDPLLDQSVHIAREWKGPVDFYFVEESFHASIAAHHIFAPAKKAFDYYVEMTKKALKVQTRNE